MSQFPFPCLCHLSQPPFPLTYCFLELWMKLEKLASKQCQNLYFNLTFIPHPNRKACKLSGCHINDCHRGNDTVHTVHRNVVGRALRRAKHGNSWFLVRISEQSNSQNFMNLLRLSISSLKFEKL